MATPDEKLVQPGNADGVTNVTPDKAEGVTKVTPDQPSTDAVSAEELKAMQDKVAKYEEDIRNIKSTFQQRESEKNKLWQEKEKTYQEQLDRARRSILDGDELKEYEYGLAQSRVSELEQSRAELEASLQQEQTLRNAMAAFIDKGVPADLLIRASADGLEAVTQVGWEWAFNQIETLKKSATAPASQGNAPQTSTSKEPPEAPEVVTDQSPTPHKTTWADIEKEYGSREEFYSRLEAGQIPVEKLPILKE